jgi:hypothetical protein
MVRTMEGLGVWGTTAPLPVACEVIFDSLVLVEKNRKRQCSLAKLTLLAFQAACIALNDAVSLEIRPPRQYHPHHIHRWRRSALHAISWPFLEVGGVTPHPAVCV